MYSPPPDPDTEQRMRAHHAHTAKALDVQVEPGAEFWGWAGRTLGAPARTATGAPAWLRLMSAPENKAAGKLKKAAAKKQPAKKTPAKKPAAKKTAGRRPRSA